MRPIRSDDAVFSTPQSPPLAKRFVLKSSRPSLLIKRAALGNLKASFHCTHWHRFFPLKKAPPLISVFSPQGRRGKPPYSVLEPLRYKVGGPSKVWPGYAGWDRLGWNGDLQEFNIWQMTLFRMMLDEAINHFCNSDS